MVATGRSRVPTAAIVLMVLAIRVMAAADGRWPRVRLTDPLAGHSARKALDVASAWLEKSSCASLLMDFRDREGIPLAERLVSLGVDVRAYLGLVVFIDETPRACVEGSLAHTIPGSRVVRLCPEAVKQIWQRSPTYAVAMFVHEMLHTMGLGENPPSSDDITRQVLARCH